MENGFDPLCFAFGIPRNFRYAVWLCKPWSRPLWIFRSSKFWKPLCRGGINRRAPIGAENVLSKSSASSLLVRVHIFDPLIRTRTCAYRGVRNASFLQNFTYVFNGWSPSRPCIIGSTPLLFMGRLLLKEACTDNGPSRDGVKLGFSLSNWLRCVVI